MNRRIYENITRLSFFIVYFWFGILKVLGLSSASPLVNDLASRTISFIPHDAFFIVLGASEMIIGILFLVKKWSKLALFVGTAHLGTTMLPLVLLPEHTWLAPGVLSMEGQYILKNVFIFSALIGLFRNTKDNANTK